jgi:hypothetical protein
MAEAATPSAALEGWLKARVDQYLVEKLPSYLPADEKG